MKYAWVIVTALALALGASSLGASPSFAKGNGGYATWCHAWHKC